MQNDAIGQLIQLFARLPGIGERSAARIAYHVLGNSREYAHALGTALGELHERVRRCRICRNYTEGELCKLCSDPKRDGSLLCVVARPQETEAIERSGNFRGRYHVLHALLSPLDGIGPDALELGPLLERVREEQVREVIVATPLSVEGEATALFLAQELKHCQVRVTRIASGMPHGGELEYTDQVTLSRALSGRREL